MGILLKKKSVMKNYVSNSSVWMRFLAWFGIFQICLLACLGMVAFYSFNQVKYQNPPFAQIFVKNVVKKTVESAGQYRLSPLRMLGYNPDFPVINLEVKQKNFRKLEHAVETDKVNDEGMRREVQVKANVRIDDSVFPVKIRVKGDRKVHWAQSDRWSYRVQVRGENTIFGMKKFSLHRPVTKNYIHEWIFHQMLKVENLINLRYNFVTLKVNGKNRGIYVIEEHFEKRLIENNGRRDGPILKGDEEGYLKMPDESPWLPIDVYESSRWQEDSPELLSQAIIQMSKFQSGDLSVDDVFDVELLGRYMAVCEILNNWHGSIFKSVKFYYNPITQKIEPIGIDGHQLGIDNTSIASDRGPLPISYWSPWKGALFDKDLNENRNFLEAYGRNLERLSSSEYLNNFFKLIKPELERNLDFLYSEIPFVDLWAFSSKGTKNQSHETATGLLFSFSPDHYQIRQKYLRKRLSPDSYIDGYVVNKTKDGVRVTIRNRQSLPIEYGKFYINDQPYSPKSNSILQGIETSQTGQWTTLEYKAIEQPNESVATSSKYGFQYRVLGATNWNIKSFSVPYVPLGSNKSVLKPVSLDEILNDLSNLPFIVVNKELKEVMFKGGIAKVFKELIIPTDFSLVANPGTTIDLLDGARIISHGSIKFLGSPQKPVILRSSDSSGQGIAIINSTIRSVFNNVLFTHLTVQPDQKSRFTSPVVLYQSPVTITQSNFSNIDAEDSLNIIRSDFLIQNVIFNDVASDAFDSDFSNGKITDTVFTNIGNDAIDVSGSNIELSNIEMNQIGDKGFSIGEASIALVDKLTIDNADIGVAVKDGSTLNAESILFNNNEVDVAVFKKKAEYGNAYAVINNTNIRPYLLELGSRLVVNGKERGVNSSDLRTKIYGK
jgi:hypothetical protein